MKIKLILALLFITALSGYSFSQSKKEKAVALKVDALKKAMIDADSAQLARMAAGELSYGHSGGTVENKKEFIERIISGRSGFVSIELTSQSVTVCGKTAIVRHQLDAVTNDGGKPGEVHLLVLLVWQQQHGEWRLLARQAVKQL